MPGRSAAPLRATVGNLKNKTKLKKRGEKERREEGERGRREAEGRQKGGEGGCKYEERVEKRRRKY